jgi:hypothetical protein
MVGILVLTQLARGKPDGEGAFLIVWLVMWAVGELFVAYTWLWNAFGKESVRVFSGLLTIKHDMLGLGRTRTFQIHEISNLRAVGLFGSMLSGASSMAYWGISGGTVAFNYRGKTHRFGIQLEEDEALGVIERLRPYLPQAA